MKHLYYAIVLTVLITACRSSKDYLFKKDRDKALYEVIARLNKQGSDIAAASALPILYNDAQQRYLNKVDNYASSNEIGRWDIIIAAYSTLQQLYNAIMASPNASSLVTPTDYTNSINSSKQAAAEAYYQQGMLFMKDSLREGFKQAYAAFQKTNQLVANYKGSMDKMSEAYQKSLKNIAIKFIMVDSNILHLPEGKMAYEYGNQFFQRRLIQELGALNGNLYPARFHTGWEAGEDSIASDWTVYITLYKLDIKKPFVNKVSKPMSKEVIVGKDSTGRAIYRTAQAIITDYETQVDGQIDVDMNIIDMATGKNISFTIFKDKYHWGGGYTSMAGDARALEVGDEPKMNGIDSKIPPAETEILAALYEKIYPKIMAKLIAAVK